MLSIMSAWIRRFAEWSDRQRNWLPLLLRLMVAATFLYHGYGKISHYTDAVAQIRGMNLPLGNLLAPLVPIVEFGGGIALVLGVATRLAAFGLCWVMIFAIAFVHWKDGFKGWEWQALLLTTCVVLMIGGPGTISLDHAIRARLLSSPR
jgi:putative oxidoreductase